MVIETRGAMHILICHSPYFVPTRGPARRERPFVTRLATFEGHRLVVKPDVVSFCIGSRFSGVNVKETFWVMLYS